MIREQIRNPKCRIYKVGNEITCSLGYSRRQSVLKKSDNIFYCTWISCSLLTSSASRWRVCSSRGRVTAATTSFFSSSNCSMISSFVLMTDFSCVMILHRQVELTEDTSQNTQHFIYLLLSMYTLNNYLMYILGVLSLIYYLRHLILCIPLVVLLCFTLNQVWSID